MLGIASGEDIGGGTASSSGGASSSLSHPYASSAAAPPPGKPVKRRLKKRPGASSKKPVATKAAILVWGCFLASIFVSLAVLIGSKVAATLGNRRSQQNAFYSSSRSAKEAVGSAGLISIDPADYRGLSMEKVTSDQHDGALSIYRPHDSMPDLGDFTPRYAKLREDVDQLLPEDLERSVGRIKELTSHTFGLVPMDPKVDDAGDQVTYDVYNCPDEPPEGYPYQWKLTRILDHWPTLDTKPRAQIHQGLCVFDFNKDFDKAMRYRNAELPFITVNDPSVVKVVERWSIPGYVETMLGDRSYGCEEMSSVHFMYGSANKPKRRHGAKARLAAAAEAEAAEPPEEKKFYTPTRHINMRYAEWEQHANVPDEELGPDKPHWYFRLITCGRFRGDVCRKSGDFGSEYILDELTFFQPKENLYMVDPSAQAGIHCRFGMKGLIAENHWDSGRNSIVVLKGMRRYILAHPKECPNLVLYPKGHPSARHSKMDWSNYDVDTYPEFANATANEIVMQPGHVLFLPGTVSIMRDFLYGRFRIVVSLARQCFLVQQPRGSTTSSVWTPTCSATREGPYSA
jgi:Cupin-like domain